VKPRHCTFHGSSERHVRVPGGNVVGFAQFGWIDHVFAMRNLVM
jgi:hypothetical protein